MIAAANVLRPNAVRTEWDDTRVDLWDGIRQALNHAVVRMGPRG